MGFHGRLWYHWWWHFDDEHKAWRGCLWCELPALKQHKWQTDRQTVSQSKKQNDRPKQTTTSNTRQTLKWIQPEKKKTEAVKFNFFVNAHLKSCQKYDSFNLNWLSFWMIKNDFIFIQNYWVKVLIE